MISMSCKSQAEAFARSLQSKLQFLDASAAMECDDVDGWSADHRSVRHNGGEAVMEKFFNYPGTTFPPRRCAQFDLLRAKYHSESDLTPAMANVPKASLLEVILNHEDDSNDSDLFFDFDIGTPEEEPARQLMSDACLINSPGSSSSPRRRDSNDSSDANSDAAKASTAYGSASSGLCSDLEGLQHCSEEIRLREAHDNTLECMSLDPENWLLQQLKLSSSSSPGDLTAAAATRGGSDSSATVTPMASPDPDESLEQKGKEEEEEVSHSLVEQTHEVSDNDSMDSDAEIILELVETNGDVGANDLGASSVADAEPMSVFAGPNKHEIAHSKLNALIALLEKDKEYTRRSPTGSGDARSKEGSPVREADGDCHGGIYIPSSPTKRSTYKCPLPTISASPANFSFLSTSLAAGGGCPPTPENGGGEDSELKARCISTPVLTTCERAFMESPKTARKKKVAVEEPLPRLNVPEKPEPLRRASSLKSGKTPPGTPGRRKIVRFADVFGLDLADVKTFLDEVPRVPKSAYKDLKNAELSDLDSDAGSDIFPSRGSMSTSVGVTSASVGAATSLVHMFNQPGGFPNFFDLLRQKKVCLENAFMVDQRSLKGTIRVQNIGFKKLVTVRYTTNEWITSTDLEAQYMQGSCDGFSDKFTFFLATAQLAVGQRVQFCIRYMASDVEYWDNNDGKNYIFQCLSNAPTSTVSTAPVALPMWPLSKEPPSSSSTPMGMISGMSDSYSSNYSHSPSALCEEPWLRYL